MLCAEEEYFTIKMFHGGQMSEDPTTYKGGQVDYIDYCSVDHISLIEIVAIVKEFGYSGYFKLWYKLPRTTMDTGFFELVNDDEVMLMCTLLPKDRYVEIYAQNTEPLSQSIPNINFDDVQVEFADDMQTITGQGEGSV